MAEHLASIFGTEKDRVNCPFYFKVRLRSCRKARPTVGLCSVPSACAKYRERAYSLAGSVLDTRPI
jgi:hypothetical protein